jgi:hypothetical protein
VPTPTGPQFTAYHATVSPQSWKNAPWVHLGDKSAANRRLDAVTTPGSMEYSEELKPEPSLFQVGVSPSARVAPHMGAAQDEETGMWADLGHQIAEGTWSPSDDYDVYPYENIDEGGTSYYVRQNAISNAQRIPRRRTIKGCTTTQI